MIKNLIFADNGYSAIASIQFTGLQGCLQSQEALQNEGVASHRSKGVHMRFKESLGSLQLKRINHKK